MTELTFLVELLLNHKLQKSTKDIISARLKEVEEGLNQRGPYALPPTLSPAMAANPAVAAQSASMQAIMARNPDLVPVAAVGQTPAAAQALASRQAAIAQGMSGVPEKGATRPRKF